jgi:hypothetical protein
LSKLDKLTKHVRNDYDKFEYNNPEFKKLYESEQKIALDLYNMHSTNEIIPICYIFCSLYSLLHTY